MATSVEEISIDYEEDGVQLVKELDKAVLTKGAWTTLMFKYQEWDPKIEDYGPHRFTIRRYRKKDGVYRQQSKFNISSREQAEKVVAVLNRWLEEPAG